MEGDTFVCRGMNNEYSISFRSCIYSMKVYYDDDSVILNVLRDSNTS